MEERQGLAKCWVNTEDHHNVGLTGESTRMLAGIRDLACALHRIVPLPGQQVFVHKVQVSSCGSFNRER
jgi:hypothetical protein